MRNVLLDENMPRRVAKGLAAAGHDVLLVADVEPTADDRRVLQLARDSRRWLLTFDADFGELVFLRGEIPPPAVLYFRGHPISSAEALSLALSALAESAEGAFTVVTREGMRTRPFRTSVNDGGA